ncbi:MAG: VWA domain-containing protein [Deltaproteobacteria bacterium]|nr:VWA domain-containing protein [Deltaproteobacteria bacterium]
MTEKPIEEERLQAIIEEMWPRLKRKHLFPEIPVPKVGKVTDLSIEEDGKDDSTERRVGLEMKEKQMTINPSFLSSLKGKMTEEGLIEALLDHGITHYTFCPWDFQTHLMLYAEAKKVMGDKESAKQATNYFIDVIADTHCVKKRATEIPELHRNLKKGNVEEVIASLYQRIWGIDLGIPSSNKEGKDHSEIVRRLARIPYLDRSRWSESIRKFTRSLKPLLLLAQQEQEARGGKGDSNPQGEHDMNHYSYEEIDEGLREYAQKTMGLSEFREVVEDFSTELKELGYGIEGGMGRGRGAHIDADILFYMKLAEHYSIPVKRLPLEKTGALHPHSHTPWEVGLPYQDIDLWTSLGKIMPGITQTWKKKEGKGRGKIEGTPDCLIIIDSSGSMINPRKNLSYAVLGAACATNAYLRNNSKVAVYNFSDAPMGGRDILDYTENREEIYRALCKYFGGGTALDLEDILPLIKNKKDLDLFVITDMKITNLETLIGFFGKIQNRITAVHIGENPYASRFEKAVEKRKNINIFTVKKKEDIPHIVLGSIREYFNPVNRGH